MICENYTLGGSWNIFGQKGAGTLGGLPNLRRAGDFYEFCENVIQFFVEIERNFLMCHTGFHGNIS